jgi:7,8-dihydropterin-6-yl-methyl-4-(beta-D-ribofuranosyl)aminobenzene 5'-phosphate synthase
VEPIALAPVESVRITTLIDNTSDALMPDEGFVKRWGPVGSSAPLRPTPSEVSEGGKAIDFLRAEHGYSVLVEVVRGSERHRILFDAGVTPDGLIGNLDRLQISPESFEAIVLSHGHFDHVTGLDGLIRRMGRTNVPVLIHPEFWTRRRIELPGREPFELPVTSRAALEGAGFDIVEDRRPSFLLEGAVLITGEVDRTTAFERGFPIHQAFRSGRWEADPLILDDQALLAHVEGKGLVVLTGCGHAGIVNIVRYAKALTGISRVHAIVGGFHLSGAAFEPLIADTIEALRVEDPDVIVPGHCTGWKAVHRFASTMADAFVPNSVGTRFEL